MSLVDRARREQHRLSGSGEKRVRIPLGQQLTRTFAHLGADEDEFGVELPRLQIPVRGGLVLVDRSSLERKDCRPPGDGAKPVFEAERCFDSDSSQITRSYRRRASLT